MIEEQLSDKILQDFIDDLKYRITGCAEYKTDRIFSITVEETTLRALLNKVAETALRDVQAHLCECGGGCGGQHADKN